MQAQIVGSCLSPHFSLHSNRKKTPPNLCIRQRVVFLFIRENLIIREKRIKCWKQQKTSFEMVFQSPEHAAMLGLVSVYVEGWPDSKRTALMLVACSLQDGSLEEEDTGACGLSRHSHPTQYRTVISNPQERSLPVSHFPHFDVLSSIQLNSIKPLCINAGSTLPARFQVSHFT